MIAVQRVEPAFGAALATDPPGRQRRGEPFDAKWAEIAELEQAADRRVAWLITTLPGAASA
jgi:hypothetical protein